MGGTLKPIFTEADFEQAVASANAVIYFHAEWCGPCRQMKPIVEEVAARETKHKFYHADTDTVPVRNMLGKLNLGLHAVPAMVIFREGKKTARTEGLTKATQVLAWLQMNAVQGASQTTMSK